MRWKSVRLLSVEVSKTCVCKKIEILASMQKKRSTVTQI
jgi:hypothetical protein